MAAYAICRSALMSNGVRISLLKGNIGKLSTPYLRILHPATLVPVRNSAEDYKKHNHAPLWTAERALTVALLPLIPATIMLPDLDILGNSTAVLLTMHMHWGLEAIVIDYMRPKVVGNVLAKASIVALYVFSAVTLGGLLAFNYYDCGIGHAIRMLWRL